MGVVGMPNAAARPDGRNLMAWGWVGLVVGVLATIVGFMLPVFTDPGSAGAPPYVPPTIPEINVWKWPVTWFGIGSTNIGVLLVLAGYIVHAVSLVPGSSPSSPPESMAPESAVARTATAPAASEEVQNDDADSSTIRTLIIGAVVVVVLAAALMIGAGRSREVPVHSALPEDNAIMALEQSADALAAEAAEARNEADAVLDAAE
ncbi:hypothetical protein DAH81_05135 [Sphingomonas koreensis]|uniref:hypothetical protein n=1 Tax=Sphingomonas koreensis TaxID=93064 RepID=UPI0010041D61|nr:hypothetical protein [Sphingomonas koreensis]RSY16585.1 hypothetical protein DAH81_05135 [Sphingomonas koreensis]